MKRLVAEMKRRNLTNREAEVVTLIASGLSNLEIAHQLFVTERTIKFHIENIHTKLGTNSKTQIIVLSLYHMDFQSIKAV